MRRDITIRIAADGTREVHEDNPTTVILDALIIDDRQPERRTARIETCGGVDGLIAALEPLLVELAQPAPRKVLQWRRRA